MSNELTQTSGGMSIFTDAKIFNEVGNIAKVLSQSNIIPKEYQGNIPNVLIALDMALRMRTNPMQVMQNLYVVNGRPAWSSQYIIAVINASGKYKHELKFEFSGKGDTLSCFAWTTTQDGERLEGPKITMGMAKAEGWVDRNGSKWKTMPEVMIRYRAASFFGRLYCSDMIMGIYAEEEAESMTGYASVEAIEQEARAEIAANANSVMIEAPKDYAPPSDGEATETPKVDPETGEVLENRDQQQQKASILDMARGAIMERVDYEMGRVIQNILDPNTDPRKARKITVELAFVPSADRSFIQVGATAKSKLEATTMIQTSLSTYTPMDGVPQFIENTAQVAGQISLDGDEAPTPKVLKFKRMAQ
jgi:hypothetical protein